MTQHDRDLVVLPDPEALADEAARRFVELARAAIADHGRFTVALSGGSTPRAIYQRLARPPLRDAVDWPNVHVFWGDERMVPPDDPESTYRMSRETLLAHVPIPAANIYPVSTVGGTPEAAAAAYQETIVAVLGADLPRFDLILLGIGPDGHTASLFPGQPEAARPSESLVVAVHNAPKPPPQRVTFTFKLINAAEHVVFVVAGADKAAALREVLQGPTDVARLPAQGVRPERTVAVWLVDAAVAEALKR
ncbi:MAG TPA: 6-phosphogluconolactonase [Roseiflexaceae bacterium]|nr:6-phosphogluconolactonase [Roseiflexaceae bacterium]